MAVLVLEQKFACGSAGPARHKDVFSERNSRVLIPCSGFCAPVVEVVILAMRSIKSRSDKGLRQAPGPLGGGINMFFDSVFIRLFHKSNDIIIRSVNVL